MCESPNDPTKKNLADYRPFYSQMVKPSVSDGRYAFCGENLILWNGIAEGTKI